MTPTHSDLALMLKAVVQDCKERPENPSWELVGDFWVALKAAEHKHKLGSLAPMLKLAYDERSPKGLFEALSTASWPEWRTLYAAATTAQGEILDDGEEDDDLGELTIDTSIQVRRTPYEPPKPDTWRYWHAWMERVGEGLVYFAMDWPSPPGEDYPFTFKHDQPYGWTIEVWWPRDMRNRVQQAIRATGASAFPSAVGRLEYRDITDEPAREHMGWVWRQETKLTSFGHVLDLYHFLPDILDTTRAVVVAASWEERNYEPVDIGR